MRFTYVISLRAEGKQMFHVCKIIVHKLLHICIAKRFAKVFKIFKSWNICIILFACIMCIVS
jgi:hypothetical protein